MKARVKLFLAEEYIDAVTRGPAAGMAGTTPADTQINAWLAETGHRVLTASAPSIHQSYTGSDESVIHQVVAVTVVYEANPHGIPEP